MSTINNGVGSPFRPKLHSAKKFLSLQISQTSQAISTEFNNMLRNQTNARKRKKVINEIFATEKTYQDHLHAVTSLFLAPLQVACILPQTALNTIFSNIEAIQAVNRELLSHMETLGVGDAFLAMAPFIKLYGSYANNFAKAQAELQEWEKKSTEFSTFKKAQEMREECKGLNLGSLLITPVQRVPRYKLLLESLLNKTPREHPDFEKLQAATVEINKVAHHINENIRQRENFQKMLSIQKSLTGVGAPKVLAPGRFFIREGPLLKVCGRGSQERMFFLFSDILIYAKKNGSTDKEQLTLSLLYQITCYDKSLLLYSKSNMEALNWFTCITDAISNVRTCRASLRKPKREQYELPKRSGTPLTRSAARKSRRGFSFLRQDSAMDCSNPPACIMTDTLYPMRKELLDKPYPTTPGIEGSNSKTRRPFVRATVQATTNTRSRSKETVINSPWIKNETNTVSLVGSATDAGSLTINEGASGSQETENKGAEQRVMDTWSQKRKLSFKENIEMDIFSPEEAKKRCFKQKVEVPCVQAVESPLSNVCDQAKFTPAKLKTTQYVKDEDLVQPSCVVM
ncbi:PREDICTED: LOW QUALITY PROTEIN: FYVE, RhoGEF and PH domain-containing protein 4-like [Acropora digitifera]|uniref:LOW QUALITY PROTEIN: FYVE, RhoGEF and PH domain-containing protein 4-like n=1 Tax=Acropora digitifera TaxID=70779 RepID=UPI00077A0FF9|nr:PREDICTED: LOW QUALITY PROTEIN: FYVE, RhoGEF and PH domain-containing protein 4-like [Acropora digitifera]